MSQGEQEETPPPLSPGRMQLVELLLRGSELSLSYWETEERETDSGRGPVSYVVIMAPGQHLGVFPI